MKIFISYRRKDSGRDIGRIRDRLNTAFGEGTVFRDLEDIPSGVDFRKHLEKETNECKVMLVVIGPQWASITGANGKPRLFEDNDYTRIEVETGLSRLTNNEVTVIPVLISNTPMPAQEEIPESIAELTYQNAINIRDDPDFNNDIERLIRDIRSSQGFQEDDIKIADYEPKTIYIADGSFWMGINADEGIPYETPRHEIFLPAYRIGKYPVTNSQYKVFIQDTGRPVKPSMGWDGQRVPDGYENHPVTGVTWYEALDYCRWLTERAQGKHRYSLPNEAQWERACRGGNNTIYPWGDEFDPKRSNHGRSSLASVDAYPAQNDYGCFDFVGNVRQWTCSLWGPNFLVPDAKYSYPWKNDRRNDVEVNSQIRRIVRGSSFKAEKSDLRCTVRKGELPEAWVAGVGFRVIMIEN